MYIKRETAKKILYKAFGLPVEYDPYADFGKNQQLNDALIGLDTAGGEDVKPVTRIHWVDDLVNSWCSGCGGRGNPAYRFCPHCGGFNVDYRGIYCVEA